MRVVHVHGKVGPHPGVYKFGFLMEAFALTGYQMYLQGDMDGHAQFSKAATYTRNFDFCEVVGARPIPSAATRLCNSRESTGGLCLHLRTQVAKIKFFFTSSRRPHVILHCFFK